MDHYRAGYESIRIGFGTRLSPEITDADLESYQRGEAFARRLKALGRDLEPWPVGHLLPPRGHTQAVSNADRRDHRLVKAAALSR